MKEFYVVKPAEMEVHVYCGVSDIILRKSIMQEPAPNDGMEHSEGSMRWTCDERQMRVDYAIKAEEVRANFAKYWALAGGEEPLEDVKAAKVAEMSDACHAAIIAGVDVQLSDGKKHHFSMTVEDQLNINSLYGLLASGQQAQVPYHADGEPCVYFSAADFGLIVASATSHKTWHESYFNSLRAYINSKRTANSVAAITYGVDIPDQYKSDVLKAILAAEV